MRLGLSENAVVIGAILAAALLAQQSRLVGVGATQGVGRVGPGPPPEDAAIRRPVAGLARNGANFPLLRLRVGADGRRRPVVGLLVLLPARERRDDQLLHELAAVLPELLRAGLQRHFLQQSGKQEVGRGRGGGGGRRAGGRLLRDGRRDGRQNRGAARDGRRLAERRLALRLAAGEALELLARLVDLLALQLELHLELLELGGGAGVGVARRPADARQLGQQFCDGVDRVA